MPETTETVTRLFLENLSLIRDVNSSSINYNHIQQPRIAILTDRLLDQNSTILRFIMENVQNNNQGRRTNRDGRRYSFTYDRVVTPIPRQNSAFTEVDATITTEPENFFLPVEIRATELQIEIATINIFYRTITRPLNASCPISLEPFAENEIVTMIRFCNHIFKPGQINTWFQHNCRCPVCRYDIRNYASGISNYDSDQSTEEEESLPRDTPFSVANVEVSNDEVSNDEVSSDYIRDITENILNALITEVSSNRFFDVVDGSNNDIDVSLRLSLRN